MTRAILAVRHIVMRLVMMTRHVRKRVALGGGVAISLAKRAKASGRAEQDANQNHPHYSVKRHYTNDTLKIVPRTSPSWIQNSTVTAIVKFWQP
jgi:hypothetical protein